MALDFRLGSIGTTFAVLLVGLVARFLLALYLNRRRLRDLVSICSTSKSPLSSLPDNLQPKPSSWHPVFGNILTMGKAVAAFPPNAHPHLFLNWIRQQYPGLPPVFYMDLWYETTALSFCLR